MKPIFFVFTYLCSYLIQAQSCSNLSIQLKSEIVSTCSEATMTMLHDQLDRPFLYVANKESGLTIFNISDITNPVSVTQIPSSDLANLDVMSLSQNGNFVYLALGNTFNTNQASGMAVVDVSNPASPVLTDTYVLPNSHGGSGIIKSDGNYAYLGAMVNGIAVVNVQDKNNIFLESQFIPDFTFPSQNVDSTKINARGLEIRNDTLFLCFDAGGFRIIDATNKQQLQEIGRYSNPLMNNLPRAYNNLVLKDNFAYIAVDYCGLEVIDFSDPQNPSLYSWWNPYNCPNNNWFSSPVHSNEIRMNEACKQIFLSTGKSDMMVLDITNPSQPDSCNFYGGVSNGMGTWGIDVYQNQIFLSYICALIPFTSFWSGIKILEYNPCAGATENLTNNQFDVQADASKKTLHIQGKEQVSSLAIYSVLGEKIPFTTISQSKNSTEIRVDNASPQVYFISINNEFRQQVYF